MPAGHARSAARCADAAHRHAAFIVCTVGVKRIPPPSHRPWHYFARDRYADCLLRPFFSLPFFYVIVRTPHRGQLQHLPHHTRSASYLIIILPFMLFVNNFSQRLRLAIPYTAILCSVRLVCLAVHQKIQKNLKNICRNRPEGIVIKRALCYTVTSMESLCTHPENGQSAPSKGAVRATKKKGG